MTNCRRNFLSGNHFLCTKNKRSILWTAFSIPKPKLKFQGNINCFWSFHFDIQVLNHGFELTIVITKPLSTQLSNLRFAYSTETFTLKELSFFDNCTFIRDYLSLTIFNTSTSVIKKTWVFKTFTLVIANLKNLINAIN